MFLRTSSPGVDVWNVKMGKILTLRLIAGYQMTQQINGTPKLYEIRQLEQMYFVEPNEYLKDSWPPIGYLAS